MNSNHFNNIINNKIIEFLFFAFILLLFAFTSESAIQTNSPILLIENKALTIVCNSTDYDKIEWIWKKDGMAYEDFPKEMKERIKIDENDNSLVITKADKLDVGEWICENPKNGAFQQSIKVLTRPFLLPFEEYQKTNYKSANIVEGQAFHLRCKVMDDYSRDARVNWFKYNESEHNNEYKILTPIEDTDHIRIEIHNISDKSLIIEKVSPKDRCYYVCLADNNHFNFNNTILLRVKDKLAALWPFLGIVAEVIILCTIIFIYEKRRIKPDFDESDDNTTEPKGAQDRSSKAQDVRQRK